MNKDQKVSFRNTCDLDVSYLTLALSLGMFSQTRQEHDSHPLAKLKCYHFKEANGESCHFKRAQTRLLSLTLPGRR